MPVKTLLKYTSGLVVVLFLAFLGGCSAADDGGSGNDTPGGGGNELRLTVPTLPGGVIAIRVGFSAPVQVTVSNSSGGAGGVIVTFSTTVGTLSATSARTDANGSAEVRLTAPRQVGSTLVTAAVSGGVSRSTTIFFIAGPPAQIDLVATPSTVNAGAPATLRAIVLDRDDQPVQGETVNFTVVTNISGATLSASSGVTDGDGQASVEYIAGTEGGSDEIQGAVASLTDTVTIQVIGPPGPASIELLVSSPQLDSGSRANVDLTAFVRDSNNNFLPEVAVVFRADSGGIQVVDGTTDDTGAARALLNTVGDQSNRTILLPQQQGH